MGHGGLRAEQSFLYSPGGMGTLSVKKTPLLKRGQCSSVGTRRGGGGGHPQYGHAARMCCWGTYKIGPPRAEGCIRREEGEGGVWDPKFYVPKMARQDVPNGQFSFSLTMVTLVCGGGGVPPMGVSRCYTSLPPPFHGAHRGLGKTLARPVPDGDCTATNGGYKRQRMAVDPRQSAIGGYASENEGLDRQQSATNRRWRPPPDSIFPFSNKTEGKNLRALQETVSRGELL